ncbi:MAG: GNAT family N-acetyltransferase [Caldilineaceae bacterium]|jgi:GNAT superfamily N-acetyltransferase
MPEFDFETITPVDRPDYRDLIAPVTDAVWPEFMLHDAISNEYWDTLFTDFADCQFALLSRAHGVVALANSAPLHWTEPIADLPDDGWDWALVKSAADHSAGLSPTVLCGLQISVAPDFQGHGVSQIMLTAMVDLARRKGLHTVIVPVRPSLKSLYPLTPIERYIHWKRSDGLPFDPWLRVHVRSGGRIEKACAHAMKVRGTVAEWEEWTEMRFFDSGDYIVPGALTPVHVDVEADTGLYVEPNVWVIHQSIL